MTEPLLAIKSPPLSALVNVANVGFPFSLCKLPFAYEPHLSPFYLETVLPSSSGQISYPLVCGQIFFFGPPAHKE